VNILATSNKDFKIKNGLIVEGDSATVNGNDVLTSASSIDDLDDVSITTPADSQVLAYEAATSLWKNVNPSGGSSVVVSANEPTEGLTDGSVWLDTDGAVLPASVDIVRWIKIATANQTIFTGAAESSSAVLGYVPTNEQVFLNGVQLIRGLDYTATDSESVVLLSGAAAGDVIQVITLPAIAVGDVISKDLIDAKGDLLAGVSNNTAARLAVGTNNTFLKADSSTESGLIWAQIDVNAAEENYIRYIMGV
jgi:hypothetical protein